MKRTIVPLDKQYEELKMLVWQDCAVPEVFFRKATDDEQICFYLFSTSLCELTYIDLNYQSFTAYPPSEYKKGGLDYWFSKIHPGDRRMLADKILETNKSSHALFSKQNPTPGTVNYRFKNGNNQWIWVQHTVYILSVTSDGSIDKMLHKLTLLDRLIFANYTHVKPFEISLNESGHQEGIDQLTKREKQVLKQIAEGFSSKMIADNLNISVNTVETHRRHLLEKLQVKNSMELIKKAFRLFWN